MKKEPSWIERWTVIGLAAMLGSAASAGEIPGRIVYVGHDHQIYVADPSSGETKALTRSEAGRMTEGEPGIRAAALVQGEKAPPSENRYSWPEWSPDGKTILVHGSRVAMGTTLEQAGVYRLDVDRPGIVKALYENREHPPIYVYVGPTAREAALLVTQEGLLGLGLLNLDDGKFCALGLGLPFYLSWRSDGDAIVTHTGGIAEDERPAEVALIDVASARKGAKPVVKKLSEKPVLFRAPSWSPDGSAVAYAVRGEDGRGASLVVRSREGEERSLGKVSTRLVFSWVPDGTALSLAEATTPDNLMFGGVTLVNLGDGRRETIYAGAVGAFFWAPDSSQLLVLVPEFDSGEWRWLVVDRATKESREVGRFYPTPEFQFMTPHFDQFALSHRFWAPDSRHFVYFGYPSTARDEKQAVPATVWVADSKTAKVKVLAEGRVAFWSPK